MRDRRSRTRHPGPCWGALWPEPRREFGHSGKNFAGRPGSLDPRPWNLDRWTSDLRDKKDITNTLSSSSSSSSSSSNT
eukprot:1991113-Pyramimonas_sp.AAC.1